VGAPSSGSGKTTLTLALLGALRKKGLSVQAFKCGPDFIDPTLHQVVTGRSSRNLDIRMCGKKWVHSTFTRHSQSADVLVIEGVMGLFDGGTSSTASLASTLGVPVLLVLDAGRMAESAAAVVKGFETLDPNVPLMGVILNNVGSPRHLALLKEAMAAHCSTPVLGYLPRNRDVSLPERHLGLHMGNEGRLTGEIQERLSNTAAEYIDLDQVLRASSWIELQPDTILQGFPTEPGPVRIAVAMDAAFCFYYDDNLDLFRSYGAEIVPFSPLSDPRLPEEVSGVYLGGGYPELYARALSENRSMLAAIHDWVSRDGLTFAECGGFMYLTEAIQDLEGHRYPMAGCFPTLSSMKKGRSALGYREPVTLEDSFFGPGGTVLSGHEFHYSFIDEMPEPVVRTFRDNGFGLEGYRVHNTVGSYLHTHFGRNPETAGSFIAACRNSRRACRGANT